jgi:hypothetical protein
MKNLLLLAVIAAGGFLLYKNLKAKHEATQ